MLLPGAVHTGKGGMTKMSCRFHELILDIERRLPLTDDRTAYVAMLQSLTDVFRCSMTGTCVSKVAMSDRAALLVRHISVRLQGKVPPLSGVLDLAS